MCKRMMSFPVSHYHNKPCDKIKIDEIEPDDPPDDPPDELDQEPKKRMCMSMLLVTYMQM